MKALTLWRPWSDAIVRGPKRVENRSWRPPRGSLGQVIALHAGKRYDLGAQLNRAAFPNGFEPPDVDASPTGIVGVARIAGYFDESGELGEHEGVGPIAQARACDLYTDPWWTGPVGWLLDDVVAIEPVPCRGAQGLWTVPANVETLVLARVEEARRG